jgi:ATP-dependent Clp protease adaptor protein ClpS
MNIFSPSIATEEQGDVLVDTLDDKPAKVVVHNDEVNSFEHVINCFITYCKHTPNVAEQSALIIHHTGKCTVKEGIKSEMKEIADNLCAQGLDARVVEEED